MRINLPGSVFGSQCWALCGFPGVFNGQNERSPRFWCIPCYKSYRSMGNQPKGDKEMKDYLKNLQANNLDGYKAKIRNTRIIEPDAPDGTPGLRTLAEKNKSTPHCART